MCLHIHTHTYGSGSVGQWARHTTTRCPLCRHVGPSSVQSTFKESGPALVIDSQGRAKGWAGLYWMMVRSIDWTLILGENITGATCYAVFNKGDAVIDRIQNYH